MDSNYPIRVLSLGAGVQSTTLLRMSAAGEIDPFDHAVFCDTGWETKAVYAHLEKLKLEAEEANVELHVVSAGNIREDSLNPEHKFVSMPLHILNAQGKPAIGRRQCTRQYKLLPLQKKLRELAGLKKSERCKEHRVTTVIGISWDEMQRMRDPEFSWMINEYPLVDQRLTRQDCIDWHIKRNKEVPPRSSCVGCPFRSDDSWRDLKKMPEDWQDAVDFDKQVRNNFEKKDEKTKITAYLHKARVPLDQVDFRTKKEKGQNSLFDAECEGMCGL
jgi:hypothetical protein